MSAALMDVAERGLSLSGDRLPERAAALAATDAEGFAWLDGGGLERSFVAAWPDLEIAGDDLDLLDVVERHWRADRSRRWVGLVTYEAGVDALLGRRPRSRALPGISMRRFGAMLEAAHDGAVKLHGAGEAAARLADTLCRVPSVSPSWPFGVLRPRWAPDDYRDRVWAVKDHLCRGDSYQINLAQRFDAGWVTGRSPGSLAHGAASAFLALRERSPAPMGGLLRHCDAFVLSNAPETLLDARLGGNGESIVRSSPIKGTRPRGASPSEDDTARCELLASEKDAAEHVMIVDLVRNDLGRVARAGSVQAPPRPRLLTLPTVHHLVSDVTARVPDGVSLRELVLALFPGGSITGAPKRRTVEIIESLEDTPRGIYCGALVLLEPDRIQLSIAIRTALATTEGLHLHAGGGIVIDSDPESERHESLTKTRAFTPP